MKATYPSDRKNRHFAHRFVRLMSKSCAAQQMGPEAFTLCTIIAHQEDAKRYSGAVTFFNEQLMPVCGLSSWRRLTRARQQAVKAGWLHYQPGGKSKAGLYWVTIPAGLEDLDDTPINEGGFSYDESEGETGKSTAVHLSKRRCNRREKRVSICQSAGANVDHSTLTLSLTLKECAHKEKLLQLAEGWNALPDEYGPRVRKLDSDAILTGWARVQKHAEPREHFQDVAAIVAEIRRSDFLRGQSWFRFPWLFGRDRGREWNVVKLMEGTYRNSNNRSKTRVQTNGDYDHLAVSSS